jgi:hypothetical protein
MVEVDHADMWSSMREVRGSRIFEPRTILEPEAATAQHRDEALIVLSKRVVGT